MKDKNKKRDPMPPPDATPEEIGEFWDTHSLADYWDETHEVEFQVNLKSPESLSPDEAEGVEQGWQKLKKLVQSVESADFEKLAAVLLKSFLNIPFVVARSGDQPSGDARSLTGEVSIQSKRYTGKGIPNAKAVEGDIHHVIRELPYLEVYVLVVARDAAQLHDTLDAVSEATGLDIVVLELTDELSELGALCVTFWEDIRDFFALSDTDQEFSDWVQAARDEPKTHEKIKDVRDKLKDGIQTQKHVQKDIEKYLLERFSRDQGFNSINLSQAIERKSLESKIMDWWTDNRQLVCCLKGKEGHGKSWLAAKGMTSICKNENIVAFWLDSKDWSGHKSIFDLLHTCFSLIYPSYEQWKIAKLQSKPAKIWRKTLIVLDGVNERNALETADRILSEYFRHENEWGSRIRFLLTTRPLNDYPDLWSRCHEISVDHFNDSELQEMLTLNRLQPDDLPNSLKDTAKIPRYFQRCLELRDELGSFAVVTPEMVLLADLADKIKRSDQQIKRKLGWIRPEDPKDFFSNLAKQIEWDKIDAAPERLGQLLKGCFSDYPKIRRDLEEQRIVSKAGLYDAKLSADYVLLCWTLYLSNLFDNTKSTRIEDLLEHFQKELEPILSEDLRIEALFAALQLSAIFPNIDLSQDQLSQKRAALMLVWFHSHNAKVTNDRLSFWAKEDPDAYAQVVEFKFKHHNSPNDEETLIAPLAKTWLNKKGDLNRLASRLTKWLLLTNTDNLTENVDHINRREDPFPTMYYTRNRLLAAALSILSQRPERQFLEKLAHCYENSTAKAQFKADIGRLMRWGYTEEVLGNLYWLAERSKHDEQLLEGIYGLAANLALVDLPLLLQRPLSEEGKEGIPRAEEWYSNFLLNRIRNQERLLTDESTADNLKGNYHGLDYLAVRTDLPDLCREDQVQIKKVLHNISVNAELVRSMWSTLENFYMVSLMPWVAKYDSKSYAELACNLKLNTLNQQWAQFKLCSIQGLIFQPDDCAKITEAILKMKQRLVQDIQVDSLSSDTIDLTSLLTETLLFCAPEEELTDWFEFLVSHEPLRESIFTETLQVLLNTLLSEPVLRFVQQKLKIPRSSSLDNQFPSNIVSEKITEEDFWWWIYLCISDSDEDTVTWALENLKRRKSDLRVMTYYFLDKAMSDSNRFLSGIFMDKEVRKHLFLKDGRFFRTPIYKGGNSYSYEDLVSVLPQEVVGSFFCSPDRRADLSRWGKKLMKRMCLILRGDETNCNSIGELRFTVNLKALETWAAHNTTDFLELANEYFVLLSKSGWYCRGLYDFVDNILCLLLRFQPDRAMNYYHRLKTEGVRTIFFAYGGVETFFAQLWRVEECYLPEHRSLRRTALEECLNDEEIMFMTLAALIEGGQEELWSLVTQEYIKSLYAKERNLGVSILPWFGNDKAIEKLEELTSNDLSQWVREHAAWAYEVAQQERSCREVYREALQTRDPFRISAVFEQIKPALSPTAHWWCRQIHEEELDQELQDEKPKLIALVDRFWARWERSKSTNSNIEVFGRKLREYCRGEKLPMGSPPRIAPWWKPASDSDSP